MLFPQPSKLLFLPGALGTTQFWKPVADRLSHRSSKICLGWPGFDSVPADPKVNGIDDLVTRVVDHIDQPTALIAQSMGGVIAIRAALEKPELITHLVLSVTSGGINMANHAAQDWRPAVQEVNPLLPPWFYHYQQDLALRLHEIRVPTLLLWGDADPISPVSIGQHLALLLPNAKLHVFSGGGHDLANAFADEIAPLIDEHLKKAV